MSTLEFPSVIKYQDVSSKRGQSADTVSETYGWSLPCLSFVSNTTGLIIPGTAAEAITVGRFQLLSFFTMESEAEQTREPYQQ